MAGYIHYGSSTMLVYTTGSGVNGFTLDPAVGEFFLSHPRMAFPEAGSIYSINDALIDSSPEAVKRFIVGCREATGAGLKARYIGSLVTDFHRNLIKGGIYLYPSTTSNAEGKLRLTYECNPLGLHRSTGWRNGGGQCRGYFDQTAETFARAIAFLCRKRQHGARTALMLARHRKDGLNLPPDSWQNAR